MIRIKAIDAENVSNVKCLYSIIGGGLLVISYLFIPVRIKELMRFRFYRTPILPFAAGNPFAENSLC